MEGQIIVWLMVLYEQPSVVLYLQAFAASVAMAGSAVLEASVAQYDSRLPPFPTVEFFADIGVQGVVASLAHVFVNEFSGRTGRVAL